VTKSTEPTYYRMARNGPFYYKISGVEQFILRNGAWVPHSQYKNEPSWWLISGEPEFERIDRSELPAGAPD